MVEFEIDKEDVHDIKKWRRNVMKCGTSPTLYMLLILSKNICHQNTFHIANT